MPLLGSILGYRAAGRAARGIDQGYENAMAGVLGAARDAQTGLTAAGERAPELVNTATTAGNQTLADMIERIRDQVNPYTRAGETGLGTMADYLQAGGTPKFSFNMQDWINDPGYQFQLKQGTEAINNAASARGLLQSGNVLKDLTQYGQGLASTYYSDAYKRAMDAYRTNRESDLARVDVAGNLAGMGLRGTQLVTGAEENLGGQQARNTIEAGYYGGNTALNVAQLIAEIKRRAAETAGGYAIGRGQAAAAGTMNRTAALTSGIADLGDLIRMFIPGGG